MTSQPIRINPMPALVRELNEAAAARRARKSRNLQPRPLRQMSHAARVRAYMNTSSASKRMWSPTPRQRRRMARNGFRTEPFTAVEW